MTQQNPHRHHAGHDWHSAEYVDEWIARDVTRTERPGTLQAMLAIAPFAKDAKIRVLDVGGGNGLVAEAVLQAFPNAEVTVQDYSQPMLDRAAQRFEKYGHQVTYVLSDWFDPKWTASIKGPFDMAVSGIAIHNLREIGPITGVYAAIRTLLKPGGVFLNCDHFTRCGGIGLHIDALKTAGYKKAEAAKDGNPGISVAYN